MTIIRKYQKTQTGGMGWAVVTWSAGNNRAYVKERRLACFSKKTVIGYETKVGKAVAVIWRYSTNGGYPNWAK